MPCAGRSPTARAIRTESGHGRKARPQPSPIPKSLPVARTSPQPSTLRLYTEPAARAAKSAAPPWPACPKCCRHSSEQRAGRCNMRPDRRPRLPTRNRRPNRVGPQRSTRAMEPLRDISLSAAVEGEAKSSPVSFEAARGLASAIGGMLEEILQLRRALVEREAELAAGVPLVPHPEEPEHLANRLEAVLRGGAQAVGCHAAALYLLDEATSKLKLRSCWGLPLDRLTAPPRPLQGAVADLESMLGHAVVLEDTPMMRHWRAPEEFAAAVCVPVSTSTTILGTLWMFSNAKRDFTDAADEHRGSGRRTPGRRPGAGDALAGRLCRGRNQEADCRRRADAAEPVAHGRARCWTIGTWPAGPRRPSPWAAISTTGSACPTDCWPWPSAMPWTAASRRPWRPAA